MQKLKDFFQANKKPIMIIGTIVIAFFIYKKVKK